MSRDDTDPIFNLCVHMSLVNTSSLDTELGTLCDTSLTTSSSKWSELTTFKQEVDEVLHMLISKFSVSTTSAQSEYLLEGDGTDGYLEQTIRDTFSKFMFMHSQYTGEHTGPLSKETLLEYINDPHVDHTSHVRLARTIDDLNTRCSVLEDCLDNIYIQGETRLDDYIVSICSLLRDMSNFLQKCVSFFGQYLLISRDIISA
jgi:hypothetical protein